MIITFLPPAAKINVPHGDAPVLPSPAPAASANALLGSKVSDLACICGALGMAPPDFSFMRNRQVTRSIFCFCYVTLFSTLRFPLSQVPHSESFPLTAGSSAVSGETVQRVDGSWPTVPVRTRCQGESCFLCTSETGIHTNADIWFTSVRGWTL